MSETIQVSDPTKARGPVTWVGDGIYSKVRKRDGRTVFYGRIWLPAARRFRHSKLGTSLPQAERKMRQALGDPAAFFVEKDQAKRKPGPRQFEALVKEFLAGYTANTRSSYYKNISASWVEHFGKTDPAIITRAGVEDYLNRLKKEEYGPSTIRKYGYGLGLLFKWAVVRGYLTANPVHGIKLPKEPTRNIAYLSDQQEKAILGKAEPWVRRVISWALESGMRIGEITALKWRDLDRKEGFIRIDRSKTARARAIPLNDPLEAILDSLPRVIKRDSETGEAKEEPFVFLDPERARLDRWRLYVATETALELAEVTRPAGCIFNLFRHTYGTRLARLGVPMIKIAQLMGNSPRIVERHYAAFAPEAELKAVMRRLAARPTVGQTDTQDPGEKEAESAAAGSS